MPDKPLAFTSAAELAAGIKSKKLSPVELVDHVLRRIHALNPRLNAYLTVARFGCRNPRRCEAGSRAGVTLGNS